MKRKQSGKKDKIFYITGNFVIFLRFNLHQQLFFRFFSEIKNSNYATLRPFHSFSPNLTTMSENKKIL